MNSNHWLIRLGAHTLGPLSDDEFRDLAAKGTVASDTPVSRDGQTWAIAGEIEGMRFRSAHRPPPPSHDSAAVSKASYRRLITVAAIGLLLVGLMILMSVPAPPPGTAHSAGLRARESADSQAGQRTYEYWSQVRAKLRSETTTADGDVNATVARLRSMAEAIETTPTVGVDADAVGCALDAAALVRALADAGQRGNDPTLFGEALIRGAAGDPFGLSLELLNTQKMLRQQLNDVQQRMIRTRAVLSSRYGSEFPPL